MVGEKASGFRAGLMFTWCPEDGWWTASDKQEVVVFPPESMSGAWLVQMNLAGRGNRTLPFSGTDAGERAFAEAAKFAKSNPS